MDAQFKLKTQVHGNLFEAEGDRDTVLEQFRAFQEMISHSPASPVVATPAPNIEAPHSLDTASAGTVPFNEQALSKIMKAEGRIVSLTVRPSSVQDALLLMIYGQKVLQQKEFCTGGELLSGLVTTGGYSIQRIDRVLHNMGLSGDIIIMGEHRGKKYRLANTGLTKVRQIASDLLAIVA